MISVEESGRTVEEAIARALAALDVSQEDVHVEVLAAASRGVLGLGARGARVRVTVKEGTATVARILAQRLLRIMGYAPTVAVEERARGIHVEVRGESLGALIGRRGATLDAVEFLLQLMTAKRIGDTVKVSMDVGGYRARRQRVLEDIARRMARRAQLEQREVPLEPMGPRERRIIHTALAEDPHVSTFSQGEEPLRRVVIAPKGQQAVSSDRPRDEPVEG